MSALSSAEKLDSSPTPAASTPSPEVAPPPSHSVPTAYTLAPLSTPLVTNVQQREEQSTLTNTSTHTPVQEPEQTNQPAQHLDDDSDEEMLQIVTEES